MRQRVSDLDLARRLKEERQSRSWSQARIAEILGVDQAQVSRLESGARSLTSIELALLGDAFGLTTDDLLDERPVSRSLLAAARGGEGSTIASLVEQAVGMTRIVRILAEASIETPGNQLAVPIPSHGLAIDQGRKLAEAVRATLGLGSGSIDTERMV